MRAAVLLLALSLPSLATITNGTPTSADYTAATMNVTIPSTTAGDAVLFALQYRANSTDTTTSVALGAATCTKSLGRATYGGPRAVEFEVCVNVPGAATTATIVQSGTGTVTVTSIEVHATTGTLAIDTSGGVSNLNTTGTGPYLATGPTLTTTGTNSGLFLYIATTASSGFVNAVAPWSGGADDGHGNAITQYLNNGGAGSYTGAQNWNSPFASLAAATAIALKEPGVVTPTTVKHRSKILVGPPPPTINYISSSGNSNSNGYGASPALTTTQAFGNLTLNSPTGPSFVPLIEGLGNNAGGSGVESPLSMTGNQISKQSPGYIAAVFNNSQLGADYAALKQGTSAYNAGLTSISTAKTAAAGRGQAFQVVAAVYMAGGTDFGEAVPAATYQANMVQYQANWQADVFALTGQTGTLPLFLDINSKWTELGPPAARETPTYAGGGNGIQFGVLNAWMANQGKIFVVGPHYQQTFLPGTTGPYDHTDNVSNRRYGEMTGKAMKKVLVDGQAWVPLVPRAISISGATITFQCWVPVPPLVIDVTTVPDWTGSVGTGGAYRYKGFEFFDDSGSPPHITAIAVSAGDTLTITLASTPTGTAGSFRLRYDYTGFVNTIQGTANAPGGNVRDSDATPSVFGDSLANWLIGPMDNPIPYSWSPAFTSLKGVK